MIRLTAVFTNQCMMGSKRPFTITDETNNSRPELQSSTVPWSHPICDTRPNAKRVSRALGHVRVPRMFWGQSWPGAGQSLVESLVQSLEPQG